MWRSNSLESFLADMDGLDRRPAYRAAPPPDPASGTPQPPLSVVRSQSDADDTTDRRKLHRRRSRYPTAKVRAPLPSVMAASALVDHLDLPVVLLNLGAFVQFANVAARRIATRGDCFGIRARRLRLADRLGQAALEAFLNAGHGTNILPTGSQCLCRRSNGPCRYVIQGEWLNASGPEGPLAALIIYEPYRVGRVGADLLAQLYGLTHMESQLAVALYSLPKLDAAATRCGISVNTAKTHLKQVFSKCAVGSKAELLRLLALGPRAR
jgi:DNA-binding CsgD family transcriptional regulator